LDILFEIVKRNRHVNYCWWWLRKQKLIFTKRFLATMNAQMLLKMVLKFEGLSAFLALEAPQIGRLVVRDHVTLQAINIRKQFIADFAL